MNTTVDLNCDLGEGAGRDAALLGLITSANIACGAHAGDADTMRETVRLARLQGVAIGAHPGFADRENFGRKELMLSAGEIVATVREQLLALAAVAASEGVLLAHVKPHGALYNLGARDPVVADAIAEAVVSVDPTLWLYGLAGGQLLRAGQARGLRVVSEVFADRSYQADGSLTPRTRSDALLPNEAVAVAQVLRLVKEGRVRSVDGHDVDIIAETVCLHGDGKDAVTFAESVRVALLDAGVELRAPLR